LELFCRFTFGLALVLAIAASGCGYALAGRGSFLPEYIRIVGIPPVENRTSVPVEQVLTQRIRTEFIGRGAYVVRPDIAGVDAVLTNEVTSVSVQPVGFNEQQLGSRYLITLTMRVQFTETRTGEVLWSNDALTFREEYDLSVRTAGGAVEASTFFDQERSSLDRISTDVARTVVTAILEAF
jgi:hypothetical protein